MHILFFAFPRSFTTQHRNRATVWINGRITTMQLIWTTWDFAWKKTTATKIASSCICHHGLNGLSLGLYSNGDRWNWEIIPRVYFENYCYNFDKMLQEKLFLNFSSLPTADKPLISYTVLGFDLHREISCQTLQWQFCDFTSETIN